MLKAFLRSVLLLFIALPAMAVELEFYLPDEQYKSNVPTPESVLGYQVGDWHVRHDQIVQYMKALDSSSKRSKLNSIGYSHEQRELLHLVISSEQNIQNLESIRETHLKRLAGEKVPATTPLIVNLNYSVHGDESSGSNASLLVAYYLLASDSQQVKDYLDNMVIIVDPSLNPDGLSRFAQWANQHKGKNLNSDPHNREHVQDWIRGRVNHYWFDLNRDWLLLQHPESRARIAQYHKWRPNVLTDHHEMGGHSTFFFQPGIPSRKNPFTPEKNVDLTKKLAEFHATAFDEQNKLYFTEESFDDFYAGKGSTYPDLHGTIGILFEQGSSRGHLFESINGDVDFPTTVKHQVMASFSTLDGSLANKKELIVYQQAFAAGYKDFASDQDIYGYVISESKDNSRLGYLLDLLAQHQINIYPLTRDAEIADKAFAKKHSYFVPLAQPQARLIRSIFATETSFFDNTFYDVSSWNLAMAFNVEFAAVESKRQVRVGKTAWDISQTPIQPQAIQAGNYSYAIDWFDYQSPALVYELLDKGIQIRAAMKPFSAATSQGNSDFAAGTMLVHAGLQQDGWFDTFQEVVQKHNVKISAITSGLTASGIDLGSRLMAPVKKPEVLIVGGLGTNLYEVGETWYLFDRYLGFSPTIVDKRRMSTLDLSRYTHILLNDGNYGEKDESWLKSVKSWVQQGGVLWSQKRAATWLAKKELLAADYISQTQMSKRFDSKELAYGEQEALAGKQRIAGAFFAAELDLTHPLAFGFSRPELALFKNRTDLLLESKKSFSTVAKYTNKPLLAGYADSTNVEKIAEGSGVLAHGLGKGAVIGMTDDPNFRSIMYGTNRFLFNALFLGGNL